MYRRVASVGMAPQERSGSGFRRRVDDTVLILFSMVAEAVGWATEALLAQDTNRARSVIADDKVFDARCEELTALLKERLAGRPVPSVEELEELIAVLQIVPELERSADLAEHIAQRALRSLGGQVSPRARGLIETMGAVVTDMWRDAGTAYRHRSKEASFELAAADDSLDELASELVKVAVEPGGLPELAVELGLLARFYERLGDHAVNLARRIEYMGTPRRLGGTRPLLPRSAGSSTPPAGRVRRVLHSLSRFKLTPTDESFFELFRAAAENGRECAVALRELVGALPEPGELVQQVKVFEQRGDQLTVEILGRLDRTFVTPLDRQDIYALGEELDDVVDSMLAAAYVIEMSRERGVPPELPELTDSLVNMAEELVVLVGSLPEGAGSRVHLERIGHLERQGDAYFRRSMAQLLSGTYDALTVIAWKDIIEAVEDALNSIEDASDVIEGILVKQS